jgi:hypothetical protein
VLKDYGRIFIKLGAKLQVLGLIRIDLYIADGELVSRKPEVSFVIVPGTDFKSGDQLVVPEDRPGT